MISNPYLIQRGTIKHPYAETTARLSDAVSLDYMGAAEFEFGALPASLRDLQANAEIIKKTVLTSITSGDLPLKLIHCFSDEELKQYEACLLKMRDGKFHLKESSYFESWRKPSKYSAIDFWWDIQNNAMWSFDKKFMNMLPDYLVSSWKYMDEKKAQRASAS
jgi:hypothetical protein